MTDNWTETRVKRKQVFLDKRGNERVLPLSSVVSKMLVHSRGPENTRSRPTPPWNTFLKTSTLEQLLWTFSPILQSLRNALCMWVLEMLAASPVQLVIDSSSANELNHYTSCILVSCVSTSILGSVQASLHANSEHSSGDVTSAWTAFSPALPCKALF